ncbi:hypothetical protein [Streptomyces sp. NPDC088725]|uniref:hypothetical protein n=1 Tax=Streptomyces sp. NPDC088725 TaxID=3365873 RepID=UPI0037F97DBE
MISIYDISPVSTVKFTDLAVVSVRTLGFCGSELIATGLSAGSAARTTALSGLPVRPVRVRDERPGEALEAGVATAAAKVGAAAATGAEIKNQHHTMWAFRGLEPWSDPA